MIAPKDSISIILPFQNDTISTWSHESIHDSTSQLSDSSEQLRESINDLREQIATLQSTIVELQNVVATTQPARSHGEPLTFHRLQNSLKSFFLDGNQAGTDWNIMGVADLLFLSSVIIVLVSILGATYGGYIEPRDDIKIGYAIIVLLIGGFILRVSSLFGVVKSTITKLH